MGRAGAVLGNKKRQGPTTRCLMYVWGPSAGLIFIYVVIEPPSAASFIAQMSADQMYNLRMLSNAPTP